MFEFIDIPNLVINPLKDGNIYYAPSTPSVDQIILMGNDIQKEDNIEKIIYPHADFDSKFLCFDAPDRLRMALFNALFYLPSEFYFTTAEFLEEAVVNSRSGRSIFYRIDRFIKKRADNKSVDITDTGIDKDMFSPYVPNLVSKYYLYSDFFGLAVFRSRSSVDGLKKIVQEGSIPFYLDIFLMLAYQEFRQYYESIDKTKFGIKTEDNTSKKSKFAHASNFFDALLTDDEHACKNFVLNSLLVEIINGHMWSQYGIQLPATSTSTSIGYNFIPILCYAHNKNIMLPSNLIEDHREDSNQIKPINKNFIIKHGLRNEGISYEEVVTVNTEPHISEFIVNYDMHENNLYIGSYGKSEIKSYDKHFKTKDVGTNARIMLIFFKNTHNITKVEYNSVNEAYYDPRLQCLFITVPAVSLPTKINITIHYMDKEENKKTISHVFKANDIFTVLNENYSIYIKKRNKTDTVASKKCLVKCPFHVALDNNAVIMRYDRPVLELSDEVLDIENLDVEATVKTNDSYNTQKKLRTRIPTKTRANTVGRFFTFKLQSTFINAFENECARMPIFDRNMVNSNDIFINNKNFSADWPKYLLYDAAINNDLTYEDVSPFRTILFDYTGGSYMKFTDTNRFGVTFKANNKTKKITALFKSFDTHVDFDPSFLTNIYSHGKDKLISSLSEFIKTPSIAIEKLNPTSFEQNIIQHDLVPGILNAVDLLTNKNYCTKIIDTGILKHFKYPKIELDGFKKQLIFTYNDCTIDKLVVCINVFRNVPGVIVARESNVILNKSAMVSTINIVLSTDIERNKLVFDLPSIDQEILNNNTVFKNNQLQDYYGVEFLVMVPQVNIKVFDFINLYNSDFTNETFGDFNWYKKKNSDTTAIKDAEEWKSISADFFSTIIYNNDYLLVN